MNVKEEQIMNTNTQNEIKAAKLLADKWDKLIADEDIGYCYAMDIIAQADEEYGYDMSADYYDDAIGRVMGWTNINTEQWKQIVENTAIDYISTCPRLKVFDLWDNVDYRNMLYKGEKFEVDGITGICVDRIVDWDAKSALFIMLVDEQGGGRHE